MENWRPTDAGVCPTFERRKLVPKVCVTDRKPHIRTFLAEALEELGFIVCECARAAELDAVLHPHPPDLVIIGFSAGGTDADEMLATLAAREYDGLVLLLGPADSPEVAAARYLGEELGLPMMPLLAAPFSSSDLRDRLAGLLPIKVPSPLVDVPEALGARWLELWYQSKSGCAHTRHTRRGSVDPHTSSALGNCSAGGLSARSRRSAIPEAVGIRHQSSDCGLARLPGRAQANRYLDQSFSAISAGPRIAWLSVSTAS
jgi:CheY-like chemotaxis protein